MITENLWIRPFLLLFKLVFHFSLMFLINNVSHERRLKYTSGNCDSNLKVKDMCISRHLFAKKSMTIYVYNTIPIVYSSYKRNWQSELVTRQGMI